MAHARGVEALKDLRVSLGWTEYRMAKEIGISPISYRYLERTARSIRLDTLFRICDIAEEIGGIPRDKFLTKIRREIETTGKRRK